MDICCLYECCVVFEGKGTGVRFCFKGSINTLTLYINYSKQLIQHFRVKKLTHSQLLQIKQV